MISGSGAADGKAPRNTSIDLKEHTNHGSFYHYPELQFLTSALQDHDSNLQSSERLPFPSIISAEDI